jgi:hypothetical protein
MKYYKYLLVMLFMFNSFTSCKKDFLDVVDNSELTRQNYVKDLNSMEAFLNGVYVLLNRHLEHGIGEAYPELAADNLKPLPLPPQSLWQHYTWSQQKDESPQFNVEGSSLNMNGTWKGGYLIIRACSFVIEDMDKYRSADPARADNIKGQAYAIRAFVHFKLVNIFAQPYTFTPGASHPGVPYITASDVLTPFSRQTVAEVYDGIIKDINNAIKLLPANIADVRYMNRAAAKALLARTYLFKEDYAAAKNLAQEVCIEAPLLAIAAGYPNGLFNNKAPAETEVLFQATPGDAYFSSFIGRYLRGDNFHFNATNDIAILLQENTNDVRYNWVTNASGQWNVTKFPVNATGDPALRSLPEADYYHPIIRSSEMFLTAAEACARTGDENNARTYLDAIRKRADPSTASLTASGSALMDSIYKERRKELAFEGLRMYDLQRWKKGVHRIDASSGAPTTLPYPSNKAIAPIPMQDVKLAGMPQNVDY